MSNLFDSDLLTESEPAGLCGYVALRLEIEDEWRLRSLLGAEDLSADCDCELEALTCDCEQHLLASIVSRAVAPQGVLWSEEATDQEGVVEVVFELFAPGNLKELEEVVSDREHWLAVLCRQMFEGYFDRDPEFYEERGLRLLSLSASDNLYELSGLYA